MLTGDQRAICGMAACNTKQRSTALGYYEVTSPAGRTAIDRACRENDIPLPAPRPPVKKDPCEENPLACQK